MKFFERILCVVDPSHHEGQTMTRALKLAEGQQASLKVVTVVKEVSSSQAALIPGLSAGELQQSLIDSARQKLEQWAAAQTTRCMLNIEVLTGVPFLEIIREVQRNGHNLVIKTAEQAHTLERLLGSEDKHLLRKCPCPVLMLKSAAPQPFRQILAAVDIDDNYPDDELATRQELNRHTLSLATTLALSEFAQLHVVYAWQAAGESFLDSGFGRVPKEEVDAYVDNMKRKHEEAMHRLMEDTFKTLDQKAREFLEPRHYLVQGNARKEIPRQAKQLQADVVVMGTIARTCIPGLIIGNTAEAILDQLDCSVLALKPPGFVSPVTPE